MKQTQKQTETANTIGNSTGSAVPGTAAGPIYYDRHKIHTFMTDANYQADLLYFCGLMQEAGANHSLLKNCSIPDLMKEGKTWVLYKMKLKINRYPAWPEEIHLKTWVTDPERLFLPREVRTEDDAGNLIFHGKSYWLVYNFERNRPERPQVQSFLDDLEKTEDRSHWSDIQLKSIDPVDEKKSGILEKEGKVIRMRPALSCRQTDINGHITNCAYIDWILSSFTSDFHRANMPSDLEIIFYHETLETDKLELVTMPDTDNPGWYVHEVHRLHAADETADEAGSSEKTFREVACRARTAWRPREELS